MRMLNSVWAIAVGVVLLAAARSQEQPAPAGKGDVMIEVHGSTMTQLAQRLSGRVDRTIVDNTKSLSSLVYTTQGHTTQGI